MSAKMRRTAKRLPIACELSEEYAARVLRAHGIPFWSGGSVGASIAVPPAFVERAERLLRADAALAPYLTFRGETKQPPVERATIVNVEATLPTALERFSEGTLAGRVLRAAEVAEIASVTGKSFVRRLTAWDRAFVTTRLAPTRATVGEVILLSTAADPVAAATVCDVLVLPAE